MVELKNESNKSINLERDCQDITKWLLVIEGRYNIRGALEYIRSKVCYIIDITVPVISF